MATQTTITEDQLRAFNMCPKYLSFGGTCMYPDTIALLKLTFEKAITECIRADKLDPSMKYMKAMLKSSKELRLSERYMVGQVQDIHNKVGILLGELFESFKANEFYPVFGPAPWTVQVSKSAVQIQISGILKSSINQTLHLIDFSPYKTIHGLKNDPVIYLKARTIMQFVKPLFKRPQCVLHVFSISEHDKLLYHKINSENITDEALISVTKTVQAIELGLNFPILPCIVSCPFKSKCYPEVKDVFCNTK